MKKVISIFLVDDDIDDQEIFVEVLSEINASIHCATAVDGEEALTILKNNLPQVPDYLFLDLNMPRMNGRQFLKTIKTIAILKSIPVVVYSTSSSLRDKEELMTLGATYFLTKHTSLNALKEELQHVLFNEFENK